MTEAQSYATTSMTNRLTHLDLPDLNKTTLSSLEITVLGDQLAILRLGRQSTTIQMNQPDSTSNTQQSHPVYRNPSASASVKHPIVMPAMTLPKFRKFRIDWDVYTSITALPPNECTVHLYSACDPSVQNSIINAKPNFLNLPESTAIDTIESLVTKRANPMVHRMTFNSIKQGDSENIQDSVIRLQAVVPDCEFTCPDCQYDLSDINIRDQLIRGLNNNILQTDYSLKPVNSRFLKTL